MEGEMVYLINRDAEEYIKVAKDKIVDALIYLTSELATRIDFKSREELQNLVSKIRAFRLSTDTEPKLEGCLIPHGILKGKWRGDIIVITEQPTKIENYIDRTDDFNIEFELIPKLSNK